jgi:hypothetical protein
VIREMVQVQKIIKCRMEENDCYGMGMFVKLKNVAYHARHWNGIK